MKHRLTSEPVYQVVRYQWGADIGSGAVVFQTLNPTAAAIYRNVQQMTHAGAVMEAERRGETVSAYFVYGVRVAPPVSI